MLYCSECNNKIPITNNIIRCLDGTVCSNKCKLNRCNKIEKYDRKFMKFNKWDNTSYNLLNPTITIGNIPKIPSFVPIYVEDKEKMKRTSSFYIRNKDISNNSQTNENDRKNCDAFDLFVENNVLFDNFGNISIFDTSFINLKYLDVSYNILSNVINKLYKVINIIM